MAERKRRAYAPRLAPAQRREELLDAALHLVVTDGHDAATVDAVATRAGVTKPVVYGVFTGRSDLLGALLRRETGAALAQLADLLPAASGAGAGPGAGPLGQVVPLVLDRFLRAVGDAPQRWHCIVMPMPGMPAEFHAVRDEARRAVLGQVMVLVADTLPPGTDVELTAHAVVALAETAARLVLCDPGAHPPERFVAALRALLPAAR